MDKQEYNKKIMDILRKIFLYNIIAAAVFTLFYVRLGGSGSAFEVGIAAAVYAGIVLIVSIPGFINIHKTRMEYKKSPKSAAK